MVTASPKPSYDELAALVAVRAEVIARLEARVAEFEARLKQNSRNSSRPPSSDSPFVKPAPKSLREKGKRRPGRPSGQDGTTLRQVEAPDETVRHEPEVCSCCGAGLARAALAGIERRQVFEVPLVTGYVVEHQIVSRRCRCGQVAKALAPPSVNAPVSYGPRACALALGLWHGQFLARDRVASVMGEVFGLPMAPSVIASLARRAHGGLGEFEQRVREQLAVAPVAGFDETGFRAAAKLWWVHAVQDPRLTLLTLDDKRGRAAMERAGVLPGFTGTAVHDAWAPYDTYTAATHALCGAHLLRELIAVTETGTDGDEGSIAYAKQAITALLALKKLAATAHALGTRPDPAAVTQQGAAVYSAAELGRRATAGRENKLVAKHHALFLRLRERKDDYLRFVHDPRVPFDNNASERAIRMVKQRIKVSGSMRSEHGARAFLRIRSYLQTTAKNGIGWLQALTDLFHHIPWLPDTPPAGTAPTA